MCYSFLDLSYFIEVLLLPKYNSVGRDSYSTFFKVILK